MLTEMLEKLTIQNNETTRTDFAFKDTKFHMRDQNDKQVPYLTIDGNDLEILPKAQDSLFEVLDIPKPYASRCPSSFLEATTDFWLKSRGEAIHSALLQTSDDGDWKIRSFMNPTYPYVPTIDVFNAVVDLIPDSYVGNYHIDDDATELTLFAPVYDGELIDSPVKAGLRFVHSDSWSVSPKFDGYLCRIACFNSAFLPITDRKFRIAGKTYTEIIDQARDFTMLALEGVQPMIDGMQQLVQHKVENFLMLLKSFCKDNKIADKIRRTIVETSTDPAYLATMANQQIITMYDFVNLLTYVASHNPDLSENNRELLFNASGQLLFHDADRCDNCGGSL